MVSRKQSVLTSLFAVCLAAVAILVTLCPLASAEQGGKRFYPDDPLSREPAPRPVRHVEVRTVDDIYDFLENSYVTPHREGKAGKRAPRPALDVNTLGEVPDSAWYANRHAFRRMSIPELQRGPGNTTPPNPKDAWIVVGAKSDGVTPGFVIEDGSKNRYLLKFDPPKFPELCSAADVIGSKFFYALGYSTPENYVVHFRAENLEIPSGVTWRDAGGRRHPLTKQAVDDLLRPQPKEAAGTYRALASRWIEGQVVGPFSYRGTRSDDPNDTIPHQDRRVLRGLAVFSAWLNHHDTRSINTMDTLVAGKGGVRYLKHYLMDFGSILGSNGSGPKEPWIGHEYTIAEPEAAVQMVTFGFYLPRWMRSNYPKLTGVGLFDAWSFDPLKWRSNYPNPAFLMMDRQDAFWAAKQIAAFTDDEIRAIVQTGEYSDQRATDWITECLIKRRDKISEAWLSRVVPLDKFRIENGALAFDDLSTDRSSGAGPAYDIRWSRYDNDHNALTPLPGASGTKVPPLGGGSTTEYLVGTIAPRGAAEGRGPNPVTVYLRRTGATLDVVGVDR